MPDAFTIPNALGLLPEPIPWVDAVVSFHVEWSGVGRRFSHSDVENDFTGQFIENTATIAWSARQPGFSFVSDPANTSSSYFSMIGRERNGVYFNP